MFTIHKDSELFTCRINNNLSVDYMQGEIDFSLKTVIGVTMKMIHTYCIGKAHELIVKEIYSKGYERITTKGEKTLEIDGSCIVIDNPFTEPMVSDKAAFGRMFAERYADQILHGTKADF